MGRVWSPASLGAAVNQGRLGEGGSGRGERDGGELHLYRGSVGSSAALRITWLGAGVNVALAALKYAAGTLSGSAALIADAAHSLSDLLSDVVTLFVVDAARAPPDERHPYGRGRYEAVGSLTVATVLIATAGGVGWSSASALLGYLGSGSEGALSTSGFGMAAMGACAVSLLAKEALYHATVRVGREVGSQTLIANAWHHRSDAFSSVAAMVGVAGGLAGVPCLDPASGLLVSLLVVKAGVDIGWDALQEVMERSSLDEGTRSALEAAASATAGVLRVDRLRTRKMGPYLIVDLRAEVDPLISVSSAHNVARHLQSEICGRVPAVSEVLVHIAPAHHARELVRPYVEVEAEVRAALQHLEGLQGVSLVMIHYAAAGLELKVDIVCDERSTIRSASDVARRAKAVLQSIPQVTSVDVDLELDV